MHGAYDSNTPYRLLPFDLHSREKIHLKDEETTHLFKTKQYSIKFKIIQIGIQIYFFRGNI